MKDFSGIPFSRGDVVRHEICGEGIIDSLDRHGDGLHVDFWHVKFKDGLVRSIAEDALFFTSPQRPKDTTTNVRSLVKTLLNLDYEGQSDLVGALAVKFDCEDKLKAAKADILKFCEKARENAK